VKTGQQQGPSRKSLRNNTKPLALVQSQTPSIILQAKVNPDTSPTVVACLLGRKKNRKRKKALLFHYRSETLKSRRWNRNVSKISTSAEANRGWNRVWFSS